MNSPLARALRQAALAALPKRAFLKRDRGDALFVTDTPRIEPGRDWPAALNKAGFLCQSANGLLKLWPDERWLARLESESPRPPDSFCAGFLPFRGMEPDRKAIELFALGARCLDGGGDFPRFDRLLRQRAAVCLRLNGTHSHDHPCGGGLYACALLRHELKGGTEA